MRSGKTWLRIVSSSGAKVLVYLMLRSPKLCIRAE